MTTFPKAFATLRRGWRARWAEIVPVVVGLVASIVGLTTSLSVVMFKVGVTLAQTGIAVLVCDLFAPASADA